MQRRHYFVFGCKRGAQTGFNQKVVAILILPENVLNLPDHSRFMFRIFDRRKPFIDLHGADFEKEMRKSSNVVILDVRTPGEYNLGKIPGSINIDITRGDFETIVDTFDKEKTFFVYCRAGNRSIAACNILGSKGYRSYNLAGGLIRWIGPIEGVI